jgi:hypothetical protein
VRTLRVVLAYLCDDARGFDRVLALPALAHLALERCLPLVEHLATRGVPASVQSISLDPTNAAPLRETLARGARRFVENTQPAPGELLLVTDPKRMPDVAFLEYPIVITEPALAHYLPPDVRVALEVEPPRPEFDGWRRVGELAFSDGAACVAVPDRAGGSRIHVQRSYSGHASLVDTGLHVHSIGPVYVRVGNLTPDRPVLVLWRRDSREAWPVIQVVANGETLRRDPPVQTLHWTNWVFVVPASAVRDATLQLVIDGERDHPFTLYTASFYQPLR